MYKHVLKNKLSPLYRNVCRIKQPLSIEPFNQVDNLCQFDSSYKVFEFNHKYFFFCWKIHKKTTQDVSVNGGADLHNFE